MAAAWGDLPVRTLLSHTQALKPRWGKHGHRRQVFFLQHAHGDSDGFTTLISYLPSPEGTSTCLPSGPGGGLNLGQTSAVVLPPTVHLHPEREADESRELLYCYQTVCHCSINYTADVFTSLTPSLEYFNPRGAPAVATGHMQTLTLILKNMTSSSLAVQ